MADLKWLSVKNVTLRHIEQDKHGFGHGGGPEDVKAVAFANGWLFLELATGAIEVVPADRVERVYLAEGETSAHAGLT